MIAISLILFTSLAAQSPTAAEIKRIERERYKFFESASRMDYAQGHDDYSDGTGERPVSAILFPAGEANELIFDNQRGSHGEVHNHTLAYWRYENGKHVRKWRVTVVHDLKPTKSRTGNGTLSRWLAKGRMFFKERPDEACRKLLNETRAWNSYTLNYFGDLVQCSFIGLDGSAKDDKSIIGEAHVLKRFPMGKFEKAYLKGRSKASAAGT